MDLFLICYVHCTVYITHILYIRVQRIWLFLENKEYRPFDGCKIEIYDTFTIYVFWFFEPFFARLASKFEKNINMTTKKKKFWKNRKRCQKTQNFTPIWNPLKKLWKNAPNSVTFLLITFFWNIFSTLFQRNRNQPEILRFLTPFWFVPKNFFLSYFYFFELWLQMRRKRLKKTENLFLWMYLRI